ncbi:MAG: MarR family winged helix-turn-helix transcriptional regulator [Cuniculiplasma sp.]
MSEEKESIEVWRTMVETWKVWKRGVEKNLQRIDLDSTEYSILRRLVECGSMPMVQMANQIMVTQGWITGLIDSMEERDLVERLRSKDDRRVIQLNITDRGKKVFEEAKKVHMEYIENCIKHMDKDTILKTIKLLKDLKENVENSEFPPIPDNKAPTD